MDDDVIDLVGGVAEFFQRRDDAREISAGAADGPAGRRTRWEALCQIGIPALRLPEPDGVGAGLLAATAVAEELGAVLLPEPVVGAVVLNQAVSGRARSVSLSDELCSGSRVGALCGFDAVEMSASGEITGCAIIPDDNLTELVGVVATDRGTDAAALVILEPASLPPTGRRLDIDPTQPWAEVQLGTVEAVEIISLTRLEALRLRHEFMVLTLAQLVGGMQATLDATVRYVLERHQFGRPIGSFQAVKHRLADMYAATEQARAATRFAAIEIDSGRAEAAAAVGSAARWVPRAAIDVFDSAIHLHGAMGFSWELDVHLHLRRAMTVRHLLSRAPLTTHQDQE